MRDATFWMGLVNLCCLIWLIKAQFILAQALDRIETRVRDAS